MKKGIAVLLVLSVMLSLPLSANAIERSARVIPSLIFQGTTAISEVCIYGNNCTEQIDATIKLWYRNRCLETWTVSGTGYIMFSGTATVAVEKGKTYRLSVDAAFDGDVQPTVSISKLCE